MNSENLKKTVTVDGIEVPLENEKNLLEVIRKAQIEIPTFCYHSELSSYGACRLCMVQVEGRGLVASCSLPPEPGMKVKTQSEQIRKIRRMSVELVLASHDQSCPTCVRSDSCKLRLLASQLGIDKVRFKPREKRIPLDLSSPALVRDANKCVLCGDCVRYCQEIQGIGAIDFAHRGSNVQVTPAFGRELGKVECVNCGQCASVCPTGALTVRPEITAVQRDLENAEKTVVAQIAPAVRVALGELFGLPKGSDVTGKIVAALRRLGFKRVYDTSFAADLTVLEEGHEFLQRKQAGKKLPLFTSCCPAWVKYAEQYFPTLLPHLSTCRSPQQMFGSLVKKSSPVTVVSIMPCTAKKFEAKRPEFSQNGIADVDHVLTTQELGMMIKQAGIRFAELEPSAMDLPFGFASGAGVIFGNSGGVTEAVCRLVVGKEADKPEHRIEAHETHVSDGFIEKTVTIDGKSLRFAVVHGLRNAKKLALRVMSGESPYDLIEVMACPGGCISGAGQPIALERGVRQARATSLSQADRQIPVHNAADNPYLMHCYEKGLKEPGSHEAHELLHTHYESRRRIEQQGVPVLSQEAAQIKVEVCVGTSCFARGAQKLLADLVNEAETLSPDQAVAISATFCSEKCALGPTVTVNGQKIHHAKLSQVMEAIRGQKH